MSHYFGQKLLRPADAQTTTMIYVTSESDFLVSFTRPAANKCSPPFVHLTRHPPRDLP